MSAMGGKAAVRGERGRGYLPLYSAPANISAAAEAGLVQPGRGVGDGVELRRPRLITAVAHGGGGAERATSSKPARRARMSTHNSWNARRSKMPKTDKPNILVIWGDDIGIANLSCYSQGVMGYKTPNIDRLAKEGMLFTDSYGEQSCTAGRS